MIFDHGIKIAYMSSEDIDTDWLCPECDLMHKSNGTGPANLPLLTRLLQILPSEDVLGGLPSTFHDIAYRLCPAGWKVVTLYGGVYYEAVDKITADQMYLNLMLQKVKANTHNWFSEWWYTKMAYRNYNAVVTLGDSSYRGC